MKRYVGTEFGEPVQVLEDGKEPRKLVHRIRHSPSGFAWGYAGSGPADLARSILWDILGFEPRPALYQAFKWEYVSTQEQASDFELTDEDVKAFLASAKDLAW